MILPLRYRTVWIAAVVVLVVTIATGSLAPVSAVPAVDVWDKYQHAGAYSVLTMLLIGMVEPRGYPWAAVGALLFGGLMEIAQGLLTETRVMDWHDVVANSTGIAAALCCAHLGLGGWTRRFELWLLRVR
jgi:VanZ family protein